MRPHRTEHRLRVFCAVLAVVMSFGTVIELWVIGHTGDALQLLPFGLAGVVVASIAITFIRRDRITMVFHRLFMILVIGGSIFGVYEHIEHNMQFAREIRPSAQAGEIWLAGVKGANPLLAPANLGVAGLLALAATFGLRSRQAS